MKIDWFEIAVFTAAVLIGTLIYQAFISGSKLETEAKKLAS